MQLNLSLKDCSNSKAIFAILIALSLCSCMPKKKASTRLKVVASVPVVYDWTRNLMNESENTNLFLNLIVKNGLQYHTFTPGITEDNLINSADLLIYIGGPSEQWIDEVLKNNSNPKSGRLVLKLIDCIADNAATTQDEHFIFSPLKAKSAARKFRIIYASLTR